MPEEATPIAGNRSPQCLVVMYHYVHPADRTLAGGAVGPNPEQFAEQVDTLCREGEPIDWPTLCAWQQGRTTLPSHSFLLTFDDGLADHVRHVLPVLQDRGLRGTFFVAGAPLQSPTLLAAHAIHLLLAYLEDEHFLHDIEQTLYDKLDPVAPPTLLTPEDEETASRIYHYETPIRAKIKYLLNMSLSLAVRDELIGTLFRRHIGSPERWARDWYMNWTDLALMQSQGHTIGGHGHAHEPLARLDALQQAQDLQRCAALLNEGLGIGRRPVSYPFGAVNDETADAARSAGFINGFTTESRWLHRRDDSMLLPRVDAADLDHYVGVCAHGLAHRTDCA